MKTTTKITIPSRETTEHHYTCDRCGKPCGEDENTRSSYDVRRVEIKLNEDGPLLLTGPGLRASLSRSRHVRFSLEEGSAFPGSANIDAKVIDCCADCFESHVLPALVALGFTPRTEDRGW